MTVTPGSRLGPYEIVSRLGAGGMGEVFRARDTRLERSVAIKVLPEELARNSQFKVRFEREAKAISQLNHPNICTLHDVGDDYLVMELLEGETLAERIAKGPLPLADVLKFGAQIADALDRAHRADIVHRDLKPGNVMITKAGAKLLDFGLAKSSAFAVDPHSETVQHNDPLTQEGTILGTFQYMAPEQLEAEEADARTDIFALGALLYEMATGKRAFAGKTKTSLIAAIVGAQPQPISQLIALTPPALDHVIQKCLEKERDDRWQSAHDVAEELKWIAATPVDEKVARGRAAKVATAAAILLALALAGVTTMWWRARNAPKPRVAFALLAPKGHWFAARLLSPDGTAIVFSSRNPTNEGGIWIRRIDDVEPRRLTTNPDDRPVAWSPDSKWIAYMNDGEDVRQLRKIAATGGTPEVILRGIDAMGGAAAWASDGTMLFNRNFGEGLRILRPDGSQPVELSQLDRAKRESIHAWPQFLADGKRYLYVSHTIAEQKNEIWAASIDGKLRKMIIRADSLVGVAQSRLYFVNDGAIFAQPFDDDALEVSGQPRRIVDDVAFDEAGITAGAGVANNGALLYQPNQQRTVDLSWYDRNGRKLEKVYSELGMVANGLSRDGTKVVAEKWNPVKGAGDIYVVDLVRGTRSKLTSGLSHNFEPAWSPDGNRIFFVSDRDGPYDIYAQADDGATPAVPVWKSNLDKRLMDVSPSGDAFLGNEVNPKMRGDIYLVPIDAPEKRKPIVATEANEYAGGFSPDGKWIAYISDRSGRPELYMRRLDGGRSIQVSTAGANGYVWSTDGRALYVRTVANERVTIPITYKEDVVVPGTPTLLFNPPAHDYGITAATQKGFLIWTVPDPTDYINALHYISSPID